MLSGGILRSVTCPEEPASGGGEPGLFGFEAVTVRLGEQVALDHLDLRLPDRGISIVLGPSGSGKSTLLRLCNRLEVPTEGRVVFRGEDLASVDPLVLRRRVGMVFQQPTPFPGTVRENLLVAAPELDESTMGELLDEVGLGPVFLPRMAGELSGGEAQRLCLARTLAVGPEVLLMDEPTSSLDPDHRAAIEQLASGLVSRGYAVIWVTHDLAQAARLGGSQVVLSEGRRATPEEEAAFRHREGAGGY